MSSVTKLEKLLVGNGYIPKKYFTIHGYCAYVEVISINSTDIFLLSISKSYKFKLEKGENVFKIKYIQMESGDSYTKSPDNKYLERSYEEVDIEENVKRDDGGSMAGHLEEAYKHPISLKELSKEDKVDVNDVYRQVKRLKYCVQTLSYKISIMFKNYVCIISKDNSIQCYMIKHLPAISFRRMLITLDLELLCKNMKQSEQNIINIRKGVNHILDKNQVSQIGSLQKMQAETKNVIKYSTDVHQQKEKNEKYISTLEQILIQINIKEIRMLEMLGTLGGSNVASYKGMQEDVITAHQKGKIENELGNLQNLKRKIVNVMLELLEKQTHLYLSFDKICFDNIVMCDAMMKNFQDVSNIIK
jgi:hypothetical protein